MKTWMYILGGLVVLGAVVWLLTPVVRYELVAASQQSVFAPQVVKDPSVLRMYTGRLAGFPHTYEFLLTATSSLTWHLQTPPQNPDRMSLIVIKEVRRGVEEVFRNDPTNPDDNNPYQVLLSPGLYRTEVSNPVNSGEYRLLFGDVEASKEMRLLQWF